MTLQRRLWAVAGALAVIEVLALFVAFANYEDDTPGGGSGFETALAIFVCVGVVLVVVVVVAAVWTCFRRP